MKGKTNQNWTLIQELEIKDKMQCDQINSPIQSEKRIEDQFVPQHIVIDQTPVLKKNTSHSQMELCDSQFQDGNKSINVASQQLVNKYNSRKDLQNQMQSKTLIHIQTQKKIQSLFQKNKLLLQFKDKLLSLGHIYPRSNKPHLYDLLKERFIESHYNNTQINVSCSGVTKSINGKKFILNPFSQFVVVWQIFRIIQLMFLLWWVPFKVAFSPNLNNILDNLEQTLIYFMILDIFIKLNVGLIDQGQVVNNRLAILIHYFKFELYEDIIYLITLIFISKQSIQTMMIKEFLALTQFILNFFKLRKKIQNFEEVLTNQLNLIEIVNIFQLIIVIFYFAHFMACVWYYVGITSLQNCHKSWILTYDLYDAPLSICYVYSLYWATATMVTVGYGDITGQNVYEVLCSIILMFLASTIFAFSMNQIGQIFNNFDLQKQVYKRSLVLINHYMKFNEVQNSLQSRVRNYLKYYYEQELKSNVTEINSIINQLSSSLKNELLKDVQMRVIQQNNFFSKHFSESTILQIGQSLKLQQCTPKELIYQQQSRDDQSIYIIQKGEIIITDENSGKVLKTYKKGDLFGEIEFITDKPRYSNAYSKNYSTLYKISRQEFLDIIKTDFIDYQKFMQMKDEIIFNYQTDIIKCFGCEQHHLIWDCQFLFYKPDIEAVIKRELYHSYQNRSKQFYRKQKQKFICQPQSHEQSIEIEQTCKIQSFLSQQSSNLSQEKIEKIGKIEITEQEKLLFKNQSNISRQSPNNNFSEDIISKKGNKKINNVKLSKRSLDSENNYLSPSQKLKQKIQDNKFIINNNQNTLLQIKEIEGNNYTSKTTQDQLEIFQKQQEVEDDFEIFHCYPTYFKHNNIDNILNNYAKYQKQMKVMKKQFASSQFRFFQIKLNKKQQQKHKEQSSYHSIIFQDNQD